MTKSALRRRQAKISPEICFWEPGRTSSHFRTLEMDKSLKCEGRPVQEFVTGQYNDVSHLIETSRLLFCWDVVKKNLFRATALHLAIAEDEPIVDNVIN